MNRDIARRATPDGFLENVFMLGTRTTTAWYTKTLDFLPYWDSSDQPLSLMTFKGANFDLNTSKTSKHVLMEAENRMNRDNVLIELVQAAREPTLDDPFRGRIENGVPANARSTRSIWRW